MPAQAASFNASSEGLWLTNDGLLIATAHQPCNLTANRPLGLESKLPCGSV